MNTYNSRKRPSGLDTIVKLVGGLMLLIMGACTGPLQSVYDGPPLAQDQVAILYFEDPSMTIIELTQGGQTQTFPYEEHMLPQGIEVLPGTYDLTVLYEHLGRTRCWEEGFYDRCTRNVDRGWWLPGVSIIPGQTQWEAKAGTVSVVTRTENYWDVTEQGSWNPTIKEVGTEQAELMWKSRKEEKS